MKKNNITKSIIRILSSIIILLLFLIFTREIIAGNRRDAHSINSARGIDSIEFIQIGGINQALQIRGQNIDNPVLLFLHGGPGYTEMPVSYLFQDPWEYYFTVVQFDQRFAGKTYYANNEQTAPEKDSIDLRINDVIEIAEYLRKRFKQKKVVLLGHSWGSILGINTIKKRPDLFSVYVGVGQVVNFMAGEKIGYHKTLSLAKESGNVKDTETLQALTPYPDMVVDYYEDIGDDMMTLRFFQGKYGIGMPTSFAENFQIIFSPNYSISDLRYYFNDIFRINRVPMKYIVEEFDLYDIGPEYSVPTIFIIGDKDWTTPVQLMEEIYPEVISPLKELHIISDAGHNTMVDNQSEFLDVMLKSVLPLALDSVNPGI